MCVVVSINVGLPRNVEWQGKSVRTAIWKQPVHGRALGRIGGNSHAKANSRSYKHIRATAFQATCTIKSSFPAASRDRHRTSPLCVPKTSSGDDFGFRKQIPVPAPNFPVPPK